MSTYRNAELRAIYNLVLKRALLTCLAYWSAVYSHAQIYFSGMSTYISTYISDSFCSVCLCVQYSQILDVRIASRNVLDSYVL